MGHASFSILVPLHETIFLITTASGGGPGDKIKRQDYKQFKRLI